MHVNASVGLSAGFQWTGGVVGFDKGLRPKAGGSQIRCIGFEFEYEVGTSLSSCSVCRCAVFRRKCAYKEHCQRTALHLPPPPPLALA